MVRHYLNSSRQVRQTSAVLLPTSGQDTGTGDRCGVMPEKCNVDWTTSGEHMRSVGPEPHSLLH